MISVTMEYQRNTSNKVVEVGGSKPSSFCIPDLIAFLEDEDTNLRDRHGYLPYRIIVAL